MSAILGNDLLHDPSPLETQFLDLVNSGEVKKVKEFLRESGQLINLNCRNFMGCGALTIAIENRDIEMTNCLLKCDGISTKNALLMAVLTKNLEFTRIILNLKASETHRQSTTKDDLEEEFIKFSPYMSPLSVACEDNNLELVRLLLTNGHQIYEPHPSICRCTKCGKRGRISLTESKRRLHLYTAVSSPAYISLCSDDPILQCFRLNGRLQEEAKWEPEFSHEYRALSKNCISFATSLLGQCETSEESLAILNRTVESERTGYKREQFNRVWLGLENNFKSFVVHPNCQEAISEAWYDGDLQMRRMKNFKVMLVFLQHVLFLPFYFLVYFFFPFTDTAKNYGTPINKYLNNAASYAIFLVLNLVENFANRDQDTLDPPYSVIETYLIIYVFATWYKKLKYWWSNGYKVFASNKWNLYDIGMLTLFTATFLCWGLSAIIVYDHPEKKRLPRQKWNMYEPKLIGEILYSASIMSAFIRIFAFLEANDQIGPLIISMIRMFSDSLSFLTIAFIVLMSFATGLYNVYHHYAGNRRVFPDGSREAQSDYFVNMPTSLSHLFWMIFGYSDLSISLVILPEYDMNIGNGTVKIYNEHRLTENFGYFVLGLFHMFGLVVFMNMFIAFMADTYTAVVAKAREEWKFVRTKTWMTYLSQSDTMPPPFNIVPTPKCLFNVVVWIYCRIRRRFQKYRQDYPVASWSLPRCCYYEFDDDKKRAANDATYNVIMAKLIRRHFKSSTDVHTLKSKEITNSKLKRKM